MPELLQHLNNFISNPFYSFYAGTLQTCADAATQSVFRGFGGERDFCALLEREQTIGAGSAFLKFAQLVQSDLLVLQTEYKKQQP